MNSAPLEGVRLRAELYKNIQEQSKLENLYGTSYNIHANKPVKRQENSIPAVSTVYSQAAGYNSYEQNRTVNDLHVQLMETKTRSLQDLTERRMVELKLDQVSQENEKLKQRISQLDGELQAALRQCEELSRYRETKSLIEDAQLHISDLEQQISTKDKQLEALQIKLIDQQNENRVISIEHHKRIEELSATNQAQAAQIRAFELENISGLHRRIDDQDLELRNMQDRIASFESSGKTLKADYENVFLSLVAELNQLNAWICNNKSKIPDTENSALESTGNAINMGGSLRYGDLSLQSVDSGHDLLIGQLSDGMRQLYYKYGSPSASGPFVRDEKLVREVCLRLARVLEGLKHFQQANRNLTAMYNTKNTELQNLTNQLDDYEHRLTALQSQITAKDTELANFRRDCSDRDEKLAIQEAELISLRSSQEELDNIKLIALKLVDQLAAVDNSMHSSTTTLVNSQSKVSGSGSLSTDTRIRYASPKGINVRSILLDVCLALQEANEAKRSAVVELQSLQSRLNVVSDDLLFQQNRCRDLEQRHNDIIESLKTDAAEQIKNLQLDLQQASDSYSAQIAGLNEEITQRQQKLSIFAFIIYSLCKVIELDRYSLRRIMTERRLLIEMVANYNKVMLELQKLNSSIEEKVCSNIVSIDPVTGMPVEQPNMQYLSVIKERRNVIKKRKKNALIHMVLFCSYLCAGETPLVHGPRGCSLIKSRVSLMASQTQKQGARDEFFLGLDKLVALFNQNIVIPPEFYGLSSSYSSLLNSGAVQMDDTIKEKDLIPAHAGGTSILELMNLPAPLMSTLSYTQMEMSAIFKLMHYLSTIFKDAFMYSNLFDFSNRFGINRVHITSLSDHYATANVYSDETLLLNLRDPKFLISNIQVCIKFQSTLLAETQLSYQTIYQQVLASQNVITELESLRNVREREIEELAAQLQVVTIEKSRLPTEDAYAALKAENMDLSSKLRDTTNMLNAERSLHSTLQQEHEHGINKMTSEIQILREEKSRLAVEVNELTLQLQRPSRPLDAFESKSVQPISKANAKELLSRLSGSGKLQRSLSAAKPTSVHFADSLSSDRSTLVADSDPIMANEAHSIRSTHDSISLADMEFMVTTTNSTTNSSNSNVPPKPVTQLPYLPPHPPVYGAPLAPSRQDLEGPNTTTLSSTNTDYSRLIEQYNVAADSAKPTESEEIALLNRQYVQPSVESLSLDNLSTSRVEDLVKQFNIHEKTDTIFGDSTLRDANVNQYIEDLAFKH